MTSDAITTSQMSGANQTGADLFDDQLDEELEEAEAHEGQAPPEAKLTPKLWPELPELRAWPHTSYQQRQQLHRDHPDEGICAHNFHPEAPGQRRHTNYGCPKQRWRRAEQMESASNHYLHRRVAQPRPHYHPYTRPHQPALARDNQQLQQVPAMQQPRSWEGVAPVGGIMQAQTVLNFNAASNGDTLAAMIALLTNPQRGGHRYN